MKKILIALTLLVSMPSFAETAKAFLVSPTELATGCEYSVFFQPENGEKFEHLSYPNHPIKYKETTLQECINAALTTSTFSDDGYSVQVRHGSLNSSSLEIAIKH